MRLFAVIATVLVISAATLAYNWSWLSLRGDQRAAILLDQGLAAEAAELFNDPIWRGISYFKAADYGNARLQFDRSSEVDGIYNRGLAETLDRQYTTAIQSFEDVLIIDPEHISAAHNLRIAKQLARLQQSIAEQKDDEAQMESASTAEQSASEQVDTAQQQPQSANNDQSQRQRDQRGAPGGQSPTGGFQASSEAPSTDQTQQSQTQQLRRSLEQRTQQQTPMPEQAAQQSGGGNAIGFGSGSGKLSEMQQATEQWLRRIPDDPAILLRNTLKRKHQLIHAGTGDAGQPW